MKHLDDGVGREMAPTDTMSNSFNTLGVLESTARSAALVSWRAGSTTTLSDAAEQGSEALLTATA